MQTIPERQDVNLSDRQTGASEREDHDKAPGFVTSKADILQQLLRCYEEQLIKSHRHNVIALARRKG